MSAGNSAAAAETVVVAAVQSEPVWFNLAATVDKTIALLTQAASRGATILAFPETWLPGYPTFVWMGDDSYQTPFRERYRANAFVAGGTEHKRLERACGELGITAVIGTAEIDGDDLYIAQFVIDSSGRTLNRHRKVGPGHPESTIFSSAAGDDVLVSATAAGRVGSLNCAEHFRPLLKHTLFSQHEQIHVASWPNWGMYQHDPDIQPDIAVDATSLLAKEGHVLTLMATITASQPYVDELALPKERAHWMRAGGGATRIFGPDGRDLVTPFDEFTDGILYAEVPRTLIEAGMRYQDAGRNVPVI